MRYWAYLLGKICVASAVAWGLLLTLNTLWPTPSWPAQQAFRALRGSPPRFGYDLTYTLLVGLWFMLACGLLYLCVLDQRRRCRVCLHRLCMPVETGSWGRMLLFGRPRIEYICPYGHGTLKESELQISGLENPEWTRHAEMWEELLATSKGRDGRE